MNLINLQDGDKKSNKSFFEKYFLIMPMKNKWYLVWQIIFFCSTMIEGALVPYTVCIGIEEVLEETKSIEIALDIVWFINIYVSMTTSIKKDEVWQKSFKEIIANYSWQTKDLFYDVISTFPDPFIYTVHPNIYYVKLLRFNAVS